jgi:type IV pilus assembly protein PilF
MKLGWLVLPLLAALLTGCVTTETGGSVPGSTEQRLQAQLDLARGYLEKGDVANARRPLEQALKIDPSSSEAHVLMATVYLADGDKNLAEQEYLQALHDDPKNPMARNNYGTFPFAQGRYKDARKELQQAASNPKYARRAQAYENLGLTELRLDDVKAAEQSFQHALMLNTTLPRCYLELANIYFGAGNFTASKEFFEKYNSMSKPSPRSLWLGIRLSRVLNDENQLASYALALKNLFPDSEEFRLYEARQW